MYIEDVMSPSTVNPNVLQLPQMPHISTCSHNCFIEYEYSTKIASTRPYNSRLLRIPSVLRLCHQRHQPYLPYKHLWIYLFSWLNHVNALKHRDHWHRYKMPGNEMRTTACSGHRVHRCPISILNTSTSQTDPLFTRHQTSTRKFGKSRPNM